jgi:uncharacterized protein (TIGR02391 family)
MYYHVSVELKLKNGKQDTGIISDLNLTNFDEVVTDYVEPYIKNKSFYIHGTEISKNNIMYFKISNTERLANEISEAINSSNYSQGFFLTVSDAEAVFDNQYDITSKIIKATSKKIELNKIKENSDTVNKLHKKIYDVSYKKYEDGHYADAVESAFKEINTRLKNIYKRQTGIEKDGKDLMAQIFSDSNPILKLSEDITTLSGKNEQEGYRFIFMGSIIAIRNPKAHENQIISEEDAYERLIFASLLMKKIDKAIIDTQLTE